MNIPLAWISETSRWAEKRSDIAAVYVFGSYARGEETPLSDLDVAVMVPSQHPTEDAYTRWRFLSNGWKLALQRLLPVKIDLQPGNPEICTTVVGPAIAKEGVLVYSREQQVRNLDETRFA